MPTSPRMPDPPPRPGSVTSGTTSTNRWVASVTGERVERSERLVGGMSSLVERHWLEGGSSIVTRTHTDAEWLEREPDLIPNEARSLRLLAESDVRAPRLIAVDHDRPRLALSFVEGTMVTDATELAGLTDEIAEVAATIAATPLPDDHGLLPWRSWVSSEPAPPEWGDSDLWRRAIEAYLAQPPPSAGRPVLLHRDLHPLNLLWRDDRTVAVVDWVNACVGHPHAELGHLRWNLTVLSGLESADRMLDSYLARTAQAADHDPRAVYDHWWDLAPVMSFLPGPIGVSGVHDVGRTDLTVDVVVNRTEHFLASALERLSPDRPIRTGWTGAGPTTTIAP